MRFAPGETQQHVGLAARGDHRVGAAACGALGREDLGQHAAAADRRSCASGHRLEGAIPGGPERHEASLGIRARVGVEQARLIGQDHQQVGFDEVGHQRAERVVVADLDLVGDHGVVLVDHRHDAQPSSVMQRRARVEIALAIGQVGVRQQDLRGRRPSAPKVGFVRLRKTHLADCRGRLELVDLVRAPAPAEPLHALGDGAAGHAAAPACPSAMQPGDLCRPSARSRAWSRPGPRW